MQALYDVVVIGGGPAGLSAALYTVRYGLKTIVVTKVPGGRIVEAPIVENYLGMPNVSGLELAKRFVDHVRSFGVDIVIDEVVEVKRSNSKFVVATKSGKKMECYALILAVGGDKKRLGVPGEDKFLGKGVSYCATCDAPLYKGRRVAVVGGGDSAMIAAIHLAGFAREVYLVHRRRELRALPRYVEIARQRGVKFLLGYVVKEIVGDDRVRGVRLREVSTGREEVLEVDGVFIEIGIEYPRQMFEMLGIEVDEHGRAMVKPDMSTNIPGIFVAGSAAGGPNKFYLDQVVTAVAEGAIAATSAFNYITSLKSRLGTDQDFSSP